MNDWLNPMSERGRAAQWSTCEAFAAAEVEVETLAHANVDLE